VIHNDNPAVRADQRRRVSTLEAEAAAGRQEAAHKDATIQKLSAQLEIMQERYFAERDRANHLGVRSSVVSSVCLFL
jgi:hypothetical protein